MNRLSGRSAEFRANAGLFAHSVDVVRDIGDTLGVVVRDGLPLLLGGVFAVCLVLTFPVSIPVLAYYRRRKDRQFCDECKARQ